MTIIKDAIRSGRRTASTTSLVVTRLVLGIVDLLQARHHPDLQMTIVNRLRWGGWCLLLHSRYAQDG